MFSLSRATFRTTRPRAFLPRCSPKSNVFSVRPFAHQPARRPIPDRLPHISVPPRRSYESLETRRYERFTPGGSSTSTKVMVVLVGSGLVYYVIHLEQVPETGRWRFMDVSPQFESRIAKVAHDQIMQEWEGKVLPPNHIITRHIRRVVSQILAANDLGVLKSDDNVFGSSISSEGDLDGWGVGVGRGDERPPESGGKQWTLTVVNDEKVANAMAAFGDIVVFTGLLPIAKDEQGLAAVLGHEIGHVVARHSSERVSSTKVLSALGWLLAFTLNIDFGISNLITTLLLELPNSRKMELEADTIGLRLAAKACYDPRAASMVQERLSRMERSSSSFDLLRTHPGSQTRVARLNELLPEAYAIRAANPECSDVAEGLRAFSEVTGVRRPKVASEWTQSPERPAGGDILQDKW